MSPGEHLCPTCETSEFSRNHYFTGKLLLERDFVREQEYFIDKARHHQRNLHGWGVVCGLRVRQHPTPECRSRFVVVEPGTAVDCCGREIVVREETVLDFRAALDGLSEGERRLQVCLSYCECPTEPIPVLYDECGCDDAQCAPNRILESFDLHVLVDPPAPIKPLHNPGLERGHDLPVANALAVAANGAIFALQPTAVLRLDPATYAVTHTFGLADPGLALALQGDGSVAVLSRGAGDANLIILGGADLTALSTTALPDTGGKDLLLAAGGTESFVLLKAEGKALRVGASTSTLDLGATDQRALAVGSDGKTLYSVGTDVRSFDLTANTSSILAPLPAGFDARFLSVGRSSGPDFLLVAGASSAVYVTLSPVAVSGGATLPFEPKAMAVAPGGSWAAIVGDPGIVFVNASDLQEGVAQDFDNPTAVPQGPNGLVFTEDGATLLVSAPSTVATYAVQESLCSEIFWRSLDGCPRCEDDRVVLATIEGYVLGDRLEDDKDTGGAWIDNRSGRRLLPSTSALAEAIECLLHQKGGGSGQQGPKGDHGAPGAPGQNGQDGENGQDGAQGPPGPAGPAGPPGANGQDGAQGPAGPAGQNGADGKDGQGLQNDLPKIIDIGWEHESTLRPQDLVVGSQFGNNGEENLRKFLSESKDLPALLVYFNKEMANLNRRTVRVFVRYPVFVQGGFNGLVEEIGLYGAVVPFVPKDPTPHTAEGSPFAIAFVPFRETLSSLNATVQFDRSKFPQIDFPTLHLVLKGDFVWAGKDFDEGAMLDADNIGGRVGLNVTRGGSITGGKNPSGDGVMGGDFEGWAFLTTGKDDVAPVGGNILTSGTTVGARPRLTAATTRAQRLKEKDNP